MNTTDVADYLVKKAMPFRTAHEIVGNMVLYCIKHNKIKDNPTLEELIGFSDTFTEDILKID